MYFKQSSYKLTLMSKKQLLTQKFFILWSFVVHVVKLLAAATILQGCHFKAVGYRAKAR